MGCYVSLMLIFILFFSIFLSFLALLVCMTIIDSQSYSLPKPKPKPNPKAKVQEIDQLRADFNQSLSDRTDYASGKS